jgi:hypothetical protein
MQTTLLYCCINYLLYLQLFKRIYMVSSIMSKVFKYVPVFFLWLAGLTLCAHMLIPHDHHLSDPYSDKNENCNAPNNKSNHKSGFPLHCHAGNDIASEKIRVYHFSHTFQFNFTEFGALTNSYKPALHGSCKSIIDFQKPIFDSFALKLTLLRAPPSVA